MASLLESLPVELLSIVVGHLDAPSFFSLRLASRALEAVSFPTFRTKVGSDLSTLLDSDSLARLAAAPTRLAPAVRALRIRVSYPEWKFKADDPDLYEHDPDANPLRLDTLVISPYSPGPLSGLVVLNIPNQEQGTKRYINQTMTAAEVQLVNQTLDRPAELEQTVEALASALRGFPNLETVCFHDNFVLKPQVDKDQRNDYIGRSQRENFISNCFRMVWEAISQSGVKLRTFSTIDTRESEDGECTYGSRLNSSDFALSNILPVQRAEMLSQLRSLRVVVTSMNTGDSHLLDFISDASALESYTYAVDENPYTRRERQRVTSLFPSTRLPILRNIHTVCDNLHEAALTTFLENHRETLQYVNLSNCRLQSGTWQGPLLQLRKCPRLLCLQMNECSVRWFDPFDPEVPDPSPDDPEPYLVEIDLKRYGDEERRYKMHEALTSALMTRGRIDLKLS